MRIHLLNAFGSLSRLSPVDEVCLVLGGGVVQQLVLGHRGVQLGAHVTHDDDGVQSEDNKKYSVPDTEILTLLFIY